MRERRYNIVIGVGDWTGKFPHYIAKKWERERERERERILAIFSWILINVFHSNMKMIFCSYLARGGNLAADPMLISQIYSLGIIIIHSQCCSFFSFFYGTSDSVAINFWVRNVCTFVCTSVKWRSKNEIEQLETSISFFNFRKLVAVDRPHTYYATCTG